MEKPSLGFIGGGRVTRIILEGFTRKGLIFPEVVVSDLDQEVLARLREKFPVVRISPGDNKAPAGCDVVFLALHPPACAAALDEIKETLKPGAVLISLAPKITTARISELLRGFSRVVRMIPNAPSIVAAGFNPLIFSSALNAQEREELKVLFDALGSCPEVPEKDLEAYAILAAGDVMDLIPVKPLKDDEEEIRSRFRQRLGPLYEKIKP